MFGDIVDVEGELDTDVLMRTVCVVDIGSVLGCKLGKRTATERLTASG